MANASRQQIEEWYRSYPSAFASCRTFGHNPQPFTVDRPNVPKGIIVVTRKCAGCERRTTRFYSPQFVRLTERTVVHYPQGYLAPKGTGGVDQTTMTERAVAAEIALLEAAQAALKAATQPASKPARKAPAKGRGGNTTPAGNGAPGASTGSARATFVEPSSPDGGRPADREMPPRPRPRKRADPDARKRTPPAKR